MASPTIERKPTLITPEELAYDYLHCSRSKAYLLIANGEVPGVMKIGSSVRISREAVEAWIRAETGPSMSAPGHGKARG